MANTSTAASPGATPVERHGQLQVVVGRLSDAGGQPVTLRGQGFGWDNWWPQYYNADVVRWLREDWCVDMVRPAMGIEPEGAYLENPSTSKARVQAVVEAAIAEGIYVIIDWHAHDLHESEAVAFFSEMAASYGAEPNVLYEVFNEPEQDETWPEVKAYAEAVIAAIRRHDPTTSSSSAHPSGTNPSIWFGPTRSRRTRTSSTPCTFTRQPMAGGCETVRRPRSTRAFR